MQNRFHTLTCNIVVEPRTTDRFFMDMRVYKVVPFSCDRTPGESPSLLWRGIYLAVEVQTPPPVGLAQK